MKVKTIISICLFLTNVVLCAQSDDYPVYIMDGENTSFAWGRQISQNKIAIGLSEEGIYELRGSAICLVAHPAMPDRELAHFKRDEISNNTLFILGNSDEAREDFPAFGAYNPDSDEFFNASDELIGRLNPSGEIVRPSGSCFLRFNPDKNKPDKILTAFFLLYHYLRLQDNVY